MPGQRLRLWNYVWMKMLALAACILAVGWLFQQIASVRDAAVYPAPGRLVDVGGHRLHILCSGAARPGQPTVLLEGGLGAPGWVWTKVQSETAQLRVCSYDRGGYGWSEPGSAPRSAQQLASELHRLLQGAAEKPPYLLVAHSFGSLVARVYAAAYPGETAGLILLDPRHEDFFERMPPGAQITDQRNLTNARLLRVLTRSGYTRFLGNLGMLPQFEPYLRQLPAEIQPAIRARMVYRPAHWDSAVAEREAIAVTYAQAKAASLPQDLPLLVITAENGWQAWQIDKTDSDELWRASWLRLQEEQSHLSAKGEWQVIPGGGHYLYNEQPALIAAILSEFVRSIHPTP